MTTASQRPEIVGAERYYSRKLAEFGPVPRGVDWNSSESQSERFEQLLKVVAWSEGRFSLNDYGCGYGALVDHLVARGADFEYRGFDVSKAMIAAARTRLGTEGLEWASQREDMREADYTVASGVFNVKLESPEADWTEYVLETIDDIAALSRRGFAFNMLTSHSDREYMREDLFYGDPAFFLDHCLQRFGCSVALLHDYPLYEFTLLVGLGSSR